MAKKIGWFFAGLLIPFVLLFSLQHLFMFLYKFFIHKQEGVFNMLDTLKTVLVFLLPMIMAIKFWKKKREFSFGLIAGAICILL